ncbi:hypothetical protein GPJ56_009496 [Histomonas meleagridis]|uniref:uncharacterized protein n=1 Tax=Histomonas meleagridis TaxID=135588 RepID=UPI003559D1AB|nr:hypothetical protein GPJ56_009496 [Histomonas meleagridis]KAH0804637.1 hypothetical protein GO595_002573 [Histomonas meleagridis]
MFGNSICKYEGVSIEPVQPPSIQSKLRDKWGNLTKRLLLQQIKKHRSAFLIQNIWRLTKNGPRISLPDLNDMFNLELSDLQSADILCIHLIADELCLRTLHKVIDPNAGKQQNVK